MKHIHMSLQHRKAHTHTYTHIVHMETHMCSHSHMIQAKLGPLGKIGELCQCHSACDIIQAFPSRLPLGEVGCGHSYFFVLVLMDTYKVMIPLIKIPVMREKHTGMCHLVLSNKSLKNYHLILCHCAFIKGRTIKSIRTGGLWSHHKERSLCNEHDA